MANRKELPREKKLKAKIEELTKQNDSLNLSFITLKDSNKRLNKQIENLMESNRNLNDTIFTQQQLLSQNEIEAERRTKLINFLIDTKL